MGDSAAMRKFRVVRGPGSAKSKPYYVVDKHGDFLLRRNSHSAIRCWSTEKAAQKIADLCNESELNGGY
jgi:hypothetical protein